MRPTPRSIAARSLQRLGRAPAEFQLALRNHRQHQSCGRQEHRSARGNRRRVLIILACHPGEQGEESATFRPRVDAVTDPVWIVLYLRGGDGDNRLWRDEPSGNGGRPATSPGRWTAQGS